LVLVLDHFLRILLEGMMLLLFLLLLCGLPLLVLLRELVLMVR
jgi:hypothetical protein